MQEGHMVEVIQNPEDYKQVEDYEELTLKHVRDYYVINKSRTADAEFIPIEFMQGNHALTQDILLRDKPIIFIPNGHARVQNMHPDIDSDPREDNKLKFIPHWLLHPELEQEFAQMLFLLGLVSYNGGETYHNAMMQVGDGNILSMNIVSTQAYVKSTDLTGINNSKKRKINEK